MRILLDTHALLWWFTDDTRLSSRAREIIEDLENTVLVSAASAWEIATKHRPGKLQIGGVVIQRFDEPVAADGFTHLAVNSSQAIHAGTYSVDHRDPFDRIQATQAELEQAPLLTTDPAFHDFPIRCIW
ncbi:type II toxin-antitoxin system VapC family toxin [Thioalkalivibrio sp. ALJT]|uniref:type II toxin-antitoxin system VapC family toxin n=1 Tax=Thioalkalivibrio sp. ALJT TaxID=1158146 RepID=UPI00037B69FE|nr:type II toxin-antitoxin system VapC family toxin [Thioalkalivibrio sp. ALJT]